MRSLLWFFLWLSASALAAPPPGERFATREEIAATTKWFDKLTWPDLKDKPYVEVLDRTSETTERSAQQAIMRGFLLGEDKNSLTLISEGSFKSHPDSRADPIGVSQHLEKKPRGTVHGDRRTYRKLDLAKAVDDVIRSLRPGDSQKIPDLVPAEFPIPRLFALARFCTWQGRTDLADRLIAKLKQVPFGFQSDWRDVLDQPAKEAALTFRFIVETSLARARMDAAEMQIYDAAVSRPDLLARFEGIAKDFPGHRDTVAAPAYANLLRQMIAEDEAHAKAAKPLAEMTPQEQVEEWIYGLREQHGFQMFFPGDPEIFQLAFAGPGDQPADHLASLDLDAVPALIELLGDQRLTRVGGNSSSSPIRSAGINYGDCAEKILEKVSGIDFSKAPRVRGEQDPYRRAKAIRLAAAAWWKDAGERGIRRVMLDGIRRGDAASVEQARRLPVTDAVEHTEALAAGIKSARTHRVRADLIRELTLIKDESATEALRSEMTHCSSLEGRARAATELFKRGQQDAVPAMIAEWKKWKPTPRDAFSDDNVDPEPLIIFVTTCGDAGAMRAVMERFPGLPLDVRRQVLEFSTGTDFFHERVRPREAQVSPEVESLAEELAAKALDDRETFIGSWGSDDEGATYVSPRVCDFAARCLAKGWPKRYTFKWDTAAVERDRHVNASRDAWRAAKGMAPAPPAVKRPEIDTTGKSPNLLAGIRWIGGEPTAKITLSAGLPLTAQTTLETIVALHKSVPDGCNGFRFSAERTGDDRGFAVEIEWFRGPRPPVIEEISWEFHAYVGCEQGFLYSSAGGSSFHLPANHEHYNDVREKLTEAFATDRTKPIVIYFDDRMSSR